MQHRVIVEFANGDRRVFVGIINIDFHGKLTLHGGMSCDQWEFDWKYIEKVMVQEGSIGLKSFKKHQSYDYIKDEIVLPAISVGNGHWYIKEINPEIKTLELDTEFKPDYAENFEETTLQSESFNTVICLNVIEHTKHPQKIIENAYKILKPNGLFIISVPFMTNLHFRPNDYWRYSLSGLTLLCEENGFKTEHIEWFNNRTRVRGKFRK